jgi:hypothetical protein
LNLPTNKNCYKIDWKILVRDSSLEGGIHIIWNLLLNLFVISLLPPPGGAADRI